MPAPRNPQTMQTGRKSLDNSTALCKPLEWRDSERCDIILRCQSCTGRRTGNRNDHRRLVTSLAHLVSHVKEKKQRKDDLSDIRSSRLSRFWTERGLSWHRGLISVELSEERRCPSTSSKCQNSPPSSPYYKNQTGHKYKWQH